MDKLTLYIRFYINNTIWLFGYINYVLVFFNVLYSNCYSFKFYTCCLYAVWLCLLKMDFTPFVDIFKHFPGYCIKHYSNLIFWQKINIKTGKLKLHYLHMCRMNNIFFSSVWCVYTHRSTNVNLQPFLD